LNTAAQAGAAPQADVELPTGIGRRARRPLAPRFVGLYTGFHAPVARKG